MSTKGERTRRSRLARLDREERWERLGVVVFVGVVILISALWWRRGLLERAGSQASLCRADYRRAKTAVDTAMVDQRRPMIDPDLVSVAVSCGELRRGGKIPP